MRKSTTFARLFREQGSRKAVKLMSRRQWKYPAALEHQYARSIKFYLDKNWKSYAQTLIDSYVPARMDALEDIWPEDPTRGPVLGALVTIAENMEKFNQKEWDAFKKIAVGAAFSEDDAWTQAVVDEWARTQVTLITKASNDMRDAVARRVRKGVAEGQNNDEIKALIMRDLPGISTRRAAIIARDQTAKLNADLSKGRMEQAGIETYIWSTSMDERVRGLPGGKYSNAVPSHYLMEGLICRWDDPTKYRNASGEWVARPNGAPLLHPGQDILCRCVALPNWGELDELTDATPEERAQTELEMAQEALQRAQTAASYVDPSNPAYKEFEKVTLEAQKFLESLKNTSLGRAEKSAGAVAQSSLVKRVIQTEHPERVRGVQTKAQFIQSRLGVDSEQADIIYRAVDDWTGDDYSSIRAASFYDTDMSSWPKSLKEVVARVSAGESEGLLTEQYESWSKLESLRQTGQLDKMTNDLKVLEKFIADSPKWGGPPTYRGFYTSPERFERLITAMASGKELNLNGPSSWSTSKIAAEKFAKSKVGLDGHSVVLECKGPNRGTSIKALSNFQSEEEVLVSRQARYKILGTRQEGPVMIFEVEEVSNGW